jgi:hypothetical protein
VDISKKLDGFKRQGVTGNSANTLQLFIWSEASLYSQRSTDRDFNRPLTKAQAVIELDVWIMQAQELGLSCFDSFVGTLQKWLD